MIFSRKIRTSDNEIEQRKAWYNSDRTTADVSALSSDVTKHEFLTGEDVSPEKKAITRSCYNQITWILTLR